MRHLSCCLFAAVLLTAICVVAVNGGMSAKRPKVTKHHRHEHYRDHTLDHLPDITDHGVMRVLRCSSCTELSKQLYGELLQLYRQKDPTHAELIAVIDNMCQHHVNMYGLVLDPVNESATTTFSMDTSVERLQGIWINTFMKERCAHLMVNHEEDILSKHPEADSLAHFQKMVCVDWDKSCDAPKASSARSERQEPPGQSKPLRKGSYSRSLGADEM